MDIRFDGKVVLVTAASEGIGLACAEAFGLSGASVAICGRNQEKLDAAVSQLEAQGIRVFAQACDVCSYARLEAFATATEQALGPIDVFINNAGAMPKAFLDDMTEEFWDAVMDVNLKSVFMGCQIAARKMRERGGVILNASSFAALTPSVGYSAYAAAKAGAASLTRTFASELAPYGIRVLGYMPGFIDTRLNVESKKDGGEALKDPISLHRFGQAREVASVLVFLASDAAGYMTGTSIEISGGKFATQNAALPWQKK